MGGFRVGLALAVALAIGSVVSGGETPLERATYHAAVRDSALVVDVVLEFTRPVRGETALRLMPACFPLVGQLPPATDARLVVRDDAYWLHILPVGGWLFPKPKAAELRFAFRVPVAKDAETAKPLAAMLRKLDRAGALPRDWAPAGAPEDGPRLSAIPILPATQLVMDLPGDLRELAATPAAPVEAAAGRLRLHPPACELLVLQWRAAPPAKEVPPVFRVEADTSVSVAAASLRSEAVLAIEVLQGEVRSLSLLLPEGGQLRSLAGPGGTGVSPVARWEQAGGKVSVELRGPVRTKAELTVVCEQLAGKAGLVWQPVVVEGAQHQGGRVYFRAEPGLLLKAADRSGVERVSDGYAPDEAAGRQTLVLVYPRLPASVRLATEPLPARLTAAVAAVAQLERGVITQRAVIDFTILDVGVRQLQIQVGQGADVLEASCPGLLGYDVEGGVLTIRLRELVKDKVQVSLVVQRAIERADGVVIPRLLAVGVERQSGLVGVAASADVELRHARAAEAEQVDVRLLPDWAQKLAPRLAYRCFDRPNSLVAVETAPLQPEFDAEAKETATLSDDGWTREVAWHCEVHRGEVFAWRVRVPDGVVPLEVAATAAEPVPDKPPVEKSVLRDWEFDAKSRELRVALARGVKGAAKLSARFSQRVAAPIAEFMNSAIALRGPALEGARRWQGELLVRAGVPVALRAAGTKGLEARRGAERQLAFAQEAPDWELTLAATAIEPAIEVRSATVLAARPGQVAAEAELLFSIQKAPVNSLALRLPEGAANSSVQGADIRSSRLSGRDWEVRLARKVQGDYPLRVTWDHLIPAEGGACTIGAIEAPGAARHEGAILVARESDRVEVAVEQRDGLAEVDAADAAPSDLLASVRGRPVLAAYRYTNRCGLRLRVDVLGQAEVLQAKALGAVVETMLRPDGQTVTQLTYDIRNANRQFLRIGLPQEAVLLGAYVDGEPVSAAAAPDGARLVPLLGKRGADRAVEVSVVYTEQREPLAGGRTVKLASPPVDVRTEALSWAVYLPRGFRAQSADGNMSLLFRPPGDREMTLVGSMFDDESRALSQLWRWVEPWAGVFLGLLGAAAVAVAVGFGIVRAMKRARRRSTEARKRSFLRRPISFARAAAVLLVCLAIGLVLAGMFLPVMSAARSEARRTRARNNLNQIAKAMATYLNEAGDNRFYPNTLRALRKSNIIPDDSVWFDPTTNRPFVYLYDGMAMRDDFPPNEPMGYMEGAGGVNVLFFDSHVEFHAYDSPRLKELLPGRRFSPPTDGREMRGPATSPTLDEAITARELVDRYETEYKAEEEQSEKGAASYADMGAWGALKYFEQRVQRDPNDKEALEGLKKVGGKLGLKIDEQRFGDLTAKYTLQRSVALEAQSRELKSQFDEAKRLHKEGRYNEAAEQFARAGARARFLAPKVDLGRLGEDAEILLQDSLARLRAEAPGEDIDDAAKVIERDGRGKPLDHGQKMLMDRLGQRSRIRAVPRPAPRARPGAPEPKELVAMETPTRPKPSTAVKPSTGVRPDAEPGPEYKPEPGPGEKPPARPGARRVAKVAMGQPQASQYRYAPVRGGRQKGALPIAFELPSENTLPYVFHRPVTGEAQGEIELDCRPTASHRPAKGVLALGVAGLAALVALGAAKKVRRKKKSLTTEGTESTEKDTEKEPKRELDRPEE
ncbi:MAG: hypothetical protein FJ291_12125 [Planctomycetes bacterium]|nr:hypothetical protein [Planctomycetota bacterium]